MALGEFAPCGARRPGVSHPLDVAFASPHHWLQLVNHRKRKPKWRRCVAASIAVGPSATLTGSRTRPSDWGWNRRFGPVEGRRKRLVGLPQLPVLSGFSDLVTVTFTFSGTERGVKRGRAGERDGDRPSRGSRPWRSVESRAPAALILTHQRTMIVNILGIICVCTCFWQGECLILVFGRANCCNGDCDLPDEPIDWLGQRLT